MLMQLCMCILAYVYVSYKKAFASGIVAEVRCQTKRHESSSLMLCSKHKNSLNRNGQQDVADCAKEIMSSLIWGVQVMDLHPWSTSVSFPSLYHCQQMLTNFVVVALFTETNVSLWLRAVRWAHKWWRFPLKRCNILCICIVSEISNTAKPETMSLANSNCFKCVALPFVHQHGARAVVTQTSRLTIFKQRVDSWSSQPRHSALAIKWSRQRFPFTITSTFPIFKILFGHLPKIHLVPLPDEFN